MIKHDDDKNVQEQVFDAVALLEAFKSQARSNMASTTRVPDAVRELIVRAADRLQKTVEQPALEYGQQNGYDARSAYAAKLGALEALSRDLLFWLKEAGLHS